MALSTHTSQELNESNILDKLETGLDSLTPSQKLPAFQHTAMVTNRPWRTLSAFNRYTRRWAPIPLRNAQSQVTQGLSLTSRNVDTFWTQRHSLILWNVDAFSSRPVSRAKLILSHILE